MSSTEHGTTSSTGSSPLYAVDTTFLLAANSAILPTNRSGLQDRDCDKAFSHLVTYLTNGRVFHYVRPALSQVVQTVPVMELLTGGSESAKTLELTPGGTEETWDAAAGDFCDYVIHSGVIDVLDWVRFQFDDDDLLAIFFDGGEEEQVRRLCKAYDVLKKSSRFQELREKWESSGAESLSAPGCHGKTARAEFQSVLDYTLTYGFFGFAKGQFYPLQLAGEPRNCVHWLRGIALEKLKKRRLSETAVSPAVSELEVPDPIDSGLCFDWGSVVLGVAKRDQRLRSSTELAEFTRVLRSHTTQDALTSILDAGARKSGDAARTACRKAGEHFAISALIETQWDPPRVDPKAYSDRAKGWARLLACIMPAIPAIPASAALGSGAAIGAFFGGLVLAGVRTSDFLVESRWYRRMDLRMRRFLGARLFSDFSRDDIARAVDGFVAKYVGGLGGRRPT